MKCQVLFSLKKKKKKKKKIRMLSSAVVIGVLRVDFIIRNISLILILSNTMYCSTRLCTSLVFILLQGVCLKSLIIIVIQCFKVSSDLFVNSDCNVFVKLI